MKIGVLASVACVAGVFLIMVLTAITGFEYWMERDDPFGAWITVAFDLIAFGGLSAAAMHSGKLRWPLWCLAVVLTLIAAAWGGFTQFERLKDESRTRTIEAVQQTPAYVQALASLEEARTAARGWSAADPRPSCSCPETIRAWAAAHMAQAERLDAVVRVRQADLTRLIPAPSIDPLAAARGAAIEIMKLLGFLAFGAGLQGLYRAHADGEQPSLRRPRERQQKPPSAVAADAQDVPVANADSPLGRRLEELRMAGSRQSRR